LFRVDLGNVCFARASRNTMSVCVWTSRRRKMFLAFHREYAYKVG